MEWRGAAGYTCKNKNPTQRCGEKWKSFEQCELNRPKHGKKQHKDVWLEAAQAHLPRRNAPRPKATKQQPTAALGARSAAPATQKRAATQGDQARVRYSPEHLSTCQSSTAPAERARDEAHSRFSKAVQALHLHLPRKRSCGSTKYCVCHSRASRASGNQRAAASLEQSKRCTCHAKGASAAPSTAPTTKKLRGPGASKRAAASPRAVSAAPATQKQLRENESAV